MLTDRQKEILRLVVEKYIKTAQPVGSSNLSSHLNVSPATVRNEMAELVDNGFLEQLHTSSGRIPSQAGWRYYVDNFLDDNYKLSSKWKQELTNLKTGDNLRSFTKVLAKKIVELADAAVMVAYGPRDIYYTGLTNLFSQPEFQKLGLIVQLSQVIDHLDEVMSEIFNEINGLEIKVGSDNPFSQECSLLISDFKYEDGKGVFGILGPLRMDYSRNQSLLEYALNVLS